MSMSFEKLYHHPKGDFSATKMNILGKGLVDNVNMFVMSEPFQKCSACSENHITRFPEEIEIDSPLDRE